MTPTELMVLRRQHGLTQAEFGAALDPPVTRLTVSNWERAKYAVPHDIALRMNALVAVPDKPLKPTATDRTALEAYREMRHAPNNFSHVYIITMWRDRGFTPSPAAQTLIAESFPDILSTTNPEK